MERKLTRGRNGPEGPLCPAWLSLLYPEGMRTLRLTVTDSEYEAFRRAAEVAHRPMEQLLREAIAAFQSGTEAKAPLRDLPVLSGHRPLGGLPSRADLYDEMFPDEVSKGQP
jgi:hypothetical protein